ncbi:hypothetical protein [Sulfurimonas sp.]|uniref:hypothetical protein n=1 Tax=Sulfurimonas sp. TaxID=2022749 RepID=UPI002AB228FB|nr:hypothetical protein [Sulfurimonas sp.]
MKKLTLSIFTLMLSINIYASCKRTPILEYVYETKENLEIHYLSNIERSKLSLSYVQKFLNMNALSSARKVLNDSDCFLSNNYSIAKVLKKDHNYTDDMIKNIAKRKAAENNAKIEAARNAEIAAEKEEFDKIIGKLAEKFKDIKKTPDSMKCKKFSTKLKENPSHSRFAKGYFKYCK